MSAWVVSRVHIDLLVKAALVYGPGNVSNGRLSWFTVDPEEEGYGRAYATRQKLGETILADEFGQLLWTENVCSVAARYPADGWAEDHPDEARPAGDPEAAAAASYTYREPGYTPTLAETLRLLDCFEYQSCEHDGWNGSQVRRACDALRAQVCGLLAEGPWGWGPGELTEAKRRAAVSAA